MALFNEGVVTGMRVMVLASGDLWAGAEVLVYQLACGLVEIEKIEFCVVLLNQGRLEEELQNLGITVHIVEESTHSFFALVRAIRTIVTGFSPDVIHSHRYKENLLAWLVAFGRQHIKLVATQHGMPEVQGGGQRAYRSLRTTLFFRLLSCCFNRTVLVSAEMQRALVGSYGFSAKDVIVIHNGVGIPKDVIRCSKGCVVVGSAGRLFPVKDFSLLVDIAHHVILQSDVIYFILAGDGPERTLLEEKVREYGLQDRFTFSGHVDDMDGFYRSLDIYINTSIHEGMPMSVLEAMSHGLPAVVPKVGGFPEIVKEDVSGFLIEGRDPLLFAEKILYLLQSDRRCAMSVAARKRVEDHFSREVMARKYFQLYRKLIDLAPEREYK